MKAPQSRKISSTERLYRVAEQVGPPFTIQMILHGSGQLTIEQIKNAVSQLLLDSPVLRLRLSPKMVHFDGIGPKIIAHATLNVPIQEWLDSQEMPSTEQPIEIHLIEAESTTLILRVLHRAMDGEGALILLKGIFAKLRGASFSISNEYPIDRAVAKEIGGKLPVRNQPISSNHTVSIDGKFTTALISIPYKIPNAIAEISQVISGLGFPARILVPVSLRRHGSYLDCIANLSLPVYLYLEKNARAETAQSQLLRCLQNNEELNPDKNDALLGRLPFWLLKNALKSRIGVAQRKHRFVCSAYVSDLGTISLSEFSCTDFNASDFWAVPVSTALIPISIQLCSHTNETRIVISSANATLAQNIEQHLTELAQRAAPKIEKVTVSLELKSIWEKHLQMELNDDQVHTSFSELGGESIKLLFLLDDVGKEFDSRKQSEFTAHLIGRGTAVSLAEMSHLIQQLNG